MVGKNKDTILQNIAVDSVKPLIFNRLKRKPGGPKSIHYPKADWCDQEFFDSLTAEHQVVSIEKRSNKKVVQWKKKVHSAPNEVWDLMVYGYANLKYANVDLEVLREQRSKAALELQQERPAEKVDGAEAETVVKRIVSTPQKRYQSRFKRLNF
jgi:phage terminase large subunit GpA-like protein